MAGGREKRPVKGVLRRGELGGGNGLGVWDGNVAGLGCDDSYTNINIIKSTECFLFFFFFLRRGVPLWCWSSLLPPGESPGKNLLPQPDKVGDLVLEDPTLPGHRGIQRR